MRPLLPLLLTAFACSVHAADIADLKGKADKGDAEAMFQLGRLYADGKDVKKDEFEALKWYKRAAAKDHTKAEVQIGSFYAHGFGVIQDWAESIKWYRKAALKGDTTAQHNLGLDYLHGHGVEKDVEMAAFWLGKAALQGHARAQFNLGERYENGQGVEKNLDRAHMYYTLASRHAEQARIFGDAKAKEVIALRDNLAKAYSSEQLMAQKRMVEQFESLVAVHPRRFGTPGGVGPTRGWYIWREWDPVRRIAELSHEGTGEVFKTRVLPWATTYRSLNYGSGFDAILPGERINAFFSPNAEQKRGLLVHYQDEIGQMKGHGHFWKIKSIAIDGLWFTATGMAGDKSLDDKELKFMVHPTCRLLQAGKSIASLPVGVGDKAYLTWCLRDDKRMVLLACDEASLDKLKKDEAERLKEEIGKAGMSGTIDGIDGARIHVCIASTFWMQAGQLRIGDKIELRLHRTEKGEETKRIQGALFFRQNRGTYGSGVTDIVVQLDDAADVKAVRKWAAIESIRVVSR